MLLETKGLVIPRISYPCSGSATTSRKTDMYSNATHRNQREHEFRPLVQSSGASSVSAFARPYTRPIFSSTSPREHKRSSEMSRRQRAKFIAKCVAVILLVCLGASRLSTQHVPPLDATSDSVEAQRSSSNDGGLRGADTVTHSYVENWKKAHKVPWWAMKDSYSKYPKDKQVCFVHVGKTAGSTIGCEIGFNLHCQQDREIAAGLLPKYTTNMFHTDVYDCDDTSGYFLFVLRNPLERLKSAFNYDKPNDWDNFRKTHGEVAYNRKKSFYLDCPFDTFDELGQNGLNEESPARDECKQRAQTSIMGTELFTSHFYYNYQYYLEAVPEDAQILSIRTEHIIEDWNSVEVELGGKEEILGSPSKTELSHKNVNDNASDSDKYLSEESRVLICKKLCNEIQVYKGILKRSVNLNENDYAQSMEELNDSCPLEADATSCDTELPSIHEKLVKHRGYGQPAVESAYEQHWQGKYTLPNKMTKDYTLYPPKVDAAKEICLVHIGLTTGKSAGCALGFTLSDCKEGIVPGLLPRYTTRRFHCGIYDCFDDSAFYFFMLRNPIDRLVAAFNYDRPNDWENYKNSDARQYAFRRPLYYDCPFSSIEDLAQLGLAKNGNVTEECRRRASGAVDGQMQFSKHMYYNLQFHLEGIPEDARIISLRAEHLTDDWNSAESIIGGAKNILYADQTLIVSRSDNTTLSDGSRELLCEKLCNEIQVYKKILGVSVNLSKEQVHQSLSELALSCPKETDASSCSDPLPDITKKLYLGRGYDPDKVLAAPTGEIAVGRATEPEPPSPYELIWPKLKLPKYMKKSREFVVDVAKDKQICFTHIGKTAGSTVGCALGFNLHCSGNSQAPGLLPHYATNMLHCQMYDCWDDSAYALFVVRNPLDRLISAFNYDNPSKDWSKFRREYGEKHYKFRKHLYQDCPFKSLNQLAQIGLSKYGNATEECRGRAARAVEGTEHFGDHVSVFALT
mmetsp:Transcript_8181/g.18300  ORF Transcript_8181/g.18300 Transcript_8181/m.18300 type:complete len:967 (+) Transcript_8181:23-2923(+)